MEDYEKHCRLCFGTETSTEGLFEKKPEEISYADQLVEVFQLLIPNVPNYSTRICHACIASLSEAQRLRDTIDATQLYFRALNEQSDAAGVVIIEEHCEADPGDDEALVKIEEETIQEDVEPSEPEEEYEEGEELAEEEAAAEDATDESYSPRLRKRHANITTTDPDVVLVCETCGKEFGNRRNLAAHMKSHRLEAKYECNICKRFFINIEGHMKMHEKKKPKPLCPFCGLGFERLKRHIKRTHERVKHFKCPICDKPFHARNGLQRHMNVHTGQRSPCLFCPHMATHMDNARTHMKKKHPEEYEEYLRQRRLAGKDAKGAAVPQLTLTEGDDGDVRMVEIIETTAEEVDIG